MSVTRGHPTPDLYTVTFPAARQRRPLAITKLYCLATGIGVGREKSRECGGNGDIPRHSLVCCTYMLDRSCPA